MTSTLKIDTVTTLDGTGNITFSRPIVGDGSNLTGLTPIPKTVQTHVTATSSQSISANTVANITNLNATITPTAGTKILVTVRWTGEGGSVYTYDTVFGLKRDTTIIGNPDTAGSHVLGIAIISIGMYDSNADSTPDSCFYQYLDSPSTGSAITYHATFRHTTAQTMYNNRTVSDSSTYERLTSTITLQEVVAP
jgi:hypothetical protein